MSVPVREVRISSILLSPDLADVGRGRRFLSEIARQAGFSEERVFDIAVTCSEAMANAIEHSPVKGEVEVKAILYSDRLEVAVQGPGEFQAPDRLGKRETRGLGLPLMAKLSAHLALFSGPAGQTFVSLTFYLPGHRPKNQDAVPPSFRNLSEEDRLLDDVLRHLPDGFFVFDSDWHLIYLNPTVVSRLDRPPADLLGTSIWDAFPALDPGVRSALEAVKKSDKSTRITLQTDAGSSFELTVFPVTEGIAVFSRDVTEQRRADEAAVASEERYRLLFEAMLDGFAYCQMLYDQEGRPDDFVYLAVNDMFAELTGLQDVVGKRVTEIVPGIKEATPELFEIYERVASGGEPERFKINFTPLAKWLFISVSSPAPGYFVAVFEDITERKQAEEALRKSEERLKRSQEIAHLGSWELDLVKDELTWSDEVYRVFGLKPQEFAATYEAFLEHVHPADRASVDAAYSGSLAEGRDSYEIEHRVVRASTGEIRWVQEKCNHIRDDHGVVVRSVGMVLDMTERHQAEEQLRDSEERVRQKLESVLSPEGTVETLDLEDIIDSPGIQSLLDDFYRLAGIPLAIIDLEGEVLVGAGWADICTKFHRVNPGTCRNCIESDTVLTTGVPEGEFKLYKCENHMWDVATPIMVGGKHVGNIFSGQFFFEDEAVDRDLFREQAKRYGFDEASYLAALDAVPRLSRESLETGMSFFTKLAKLLSDEGYARIKLARVLAQRESFTESLRQAHGELQLTAEQLQAGAEELAAQQEELQCQNEELAAANREIAESEERFRAMFEGHGVPMLLIDPQSGRISDANEAASRFYGYSLDRLRTMNIADINQLPPDEVATERRKASASSQNTFVFQHRVADGTIRHVEVHSSPVTIHGQPTLFSIIHDVTERLRAEEALRESEEKYRLIVDTANEGIIIVDAEGRLRFVNPRFAEMLGYQPEELVGCHSFDLLVDREAAQSRFNQRLRGSSENYEFQYRRQDGSSFWAMVTGAPLRDDEGRVIGAVGMVTDITEQKRAEEALRGEEERYRVMAEENDRLYRQQLDIAESLQLALLNIPSEMGPVRIGHLYRSATQAAQVGGDFYDAFEVKGNRIAMLVGDVAGHGIEAARTATLVKDVAHAFIHQSLRPHQVLRRTNALLVEKNLPGFVSLFLAILDTETCVLRYASAGHPETLLKRASGEIQVLGIGAPPLGVFQDSSWKTNDICLQAGDLLLLYTDGVIEARRDGEFFGQKRLERLLNRKRVTVERLPHLILDQLLAFSGGRLSDDVAVLALRLEAKTGPKTGRGPVRESLLP